MKKENNVIYIKYFDYTILLIIPNLENIIHTPINRNIVNISLRNVMQPAQLKRGNLQIIKNYHLNAL